MSGNRESQLQRCGWEERYIQERKSGQGQKNVQERKSGQGQKNSQQQYGNAVRAENRCRGGRNRARRRRRRAVKRFFLCAAGLALCMWMAGLIQDMLRPIAGNHTVRAQGDAGSVGETGAAGSILLGGESGNPDSGELAELLDELLEKNEETLDYVRSYPDREKYKSQPIDLTKDFVRGEVPLLMQWDRRWGYDTYGEEMIGLAGCGPLCLEMAYLYFTENTDMTPRMMADYAYENGFYTKQGTSWSLWTEGTAGLGLEGAELSLDENVMKRALDSGYLIVCSMRPGDFTTTGHFILIRGYNEDGFLVNDPNRRSTSEKTWSYEKLQYQIRNLWSLGPG